MQEGIVFNEDAEIHYFFQGSGPLLILIPGGGGGALKYSYTFPVLSKSFTVATFVSTQSSRSRHLSSSLQVEIAISLRSLFYFSIKILNL